MEHYRVDLIVPVYNERENFTAFYDAVKAHLKSDWCMLVVYDTDADTTLDLARPISETDHRVRLVKNAGRGVLQALKSGLAAATAEAMFVTMVDDPVSVIERMDEMTERFYTENATVVVASRYMAGGEHTGGPVLKSILTYIASHSLRFLIGWQIHDATYNTRLYRKSFVDTLTIESYKGFEIALEITLKAYFAGKKLIEVPVQWSERTVGESKFRVMNWLPAYLQWYLFGIKTYWLSFVWKKSRTVESTS